MLVETCISHCKLFLKSEKYYFFIIPSQNTYPCQPILRSSVAGAHQIWLHPSLAPIFLQYLTLYRSHIYKYFHPIMYIFANWAFKKNIRMLFIRPRLTLLSLMFGMLLLLIGIGTFLNKGVREPSSTTSNTSGPIPFPNNSSIRR